MLSFQVLPRTRLLCITHTYRTFHRIVNILYFENKYQCDHQKKLNLTKFSNRNRDKILVRHDQTKTTVSHHTRVTTKPLGYEQQHQLPRVLRIFGDMTQPSCRRLSTNRLSRVDSQFVPPLEGGIGVTRHIARNNISIYQKCYTTLQAPRPTLASLRKCGSKVHFWCKPVPYGVCLQKMYMDKTSWTQKTSEQDSYFQQTS